MQLNNKILIDRYTVNKIILSNGEEIMGSSLLDDEGNILSIEVANDVEVFLNDESSFSFVEIYKNKKEIFVVGCGAEFIVPSFKIKNYLHNNNLKMEWTTTMSALHIFNLLVEDNRSCFALLINNAN